MRLIPREGALSGVLSVAAFLVSAATLYMTELRDAEITAIPAEQTYLAREGNGSAEVILVPVTLSNAGAREGAVRGMGLTVADAEGATRAYRATAFGSRPGPEAEPFAPISVPGRSAVSRAVLFYPVQPGQGLVRAAGTYALTLTLAREGGGAAPAEVRLEQRLPYFSLPELAAGRAIRMEPAAWSAEGTR